MNPPLKAFVRGVRIARVMTTSSAFFEVLLTISMCMNARRHQSDAYIVDKPEEPGVKCLRIELSLSPAIVKIGACGVVYVGERKEGGGLEWS